MGRSVHALQTVFNLNKKYLSDVQIPRTCIQKRLLYYTGKKLDESKQFWDAKILWTVESVQ